MGVEELEGTGMARIYPNPGNGEVRIELPNGTENVETMAVLDAQGRTVWEKKNVPTGASLDLQQLPSGMYVVRLSCADKQYRLSYIKL